MRPHEIKAYRSVLNTRGRPTGPVGTLLQNSPAPLLPGAGRSEVSCLGDFPSWGMVVVCPPAPPSECFYLPDRSRSAGSSEEPERWDRSSSRPRRELLPDRNVGEQPWSFVDGSSKEAARPLPSAWSEMTHESHRSLTKANRPRSLHAAVLGRKQV